MQRVEASAGLHARVEGGLSFCLRAGAQDQTVSVNGQELII